MRIAIVVFDGVEELDFAGPWEVLKYWAREPAVDAEVLLLADSQDPVRAAKDMRLLPDTTWDAAGHIDVLVLPGGRGTCALVEDTALHQRLRDLAAGGTLMTSVCTGSLVYAAAGLLRGRPATTHTGRHSTGSSRWTRRSRCARTTALSTTATSSPRPVYRPASTWPCTS